MATRKKKEVGTSSKSIGVDPLREQLHEVFAEYPEGAGQAYSFLINPEGRPFLHIADGNNIWRVRDGFIDSYINGKSDRTALWTTKNSPLSEI